MAALISPRRRTIACVCWSIQKASQTRKSNGRLGNDRGRTSLSLTSTFQILLSLLLAFSLLVAPVFALKDRSYEIGSRHILADKDEGIIFDRRPLTAPPLFRRDSPSSTAGKTGKASKTAKNADSSTSSAPEASSTSVESASSPNNSPLPKAFDGGLGTNFTQPSCSTFLQKMISNDSFSSCLPFSVLLQNSMSFFANTRTIASTTTMLDASCNIVFPACSSLMSSFALTLRSSSACSDDFDRQNPIVRQAYNGLLAYNTLYHASCLKAAPTKYNNNTSNYCFADAVTNETAPTDSYLYYLPVGVSLPAGTMPTCDQCLKDTMGVIATSASNKTQPSSLTYVNAAQMINQKCGPNFVNATIPPPTSSGSGSSAVPSVMVPGRWVGAFTVLIGMAPTIMAL